LTASHFFARKSPGFLALMEEGERDPRDSTMATWDPRANDLFLQALEVRSVDERQAYLDQVCAGDAELRREVDSLLEASARAGSFLESPAPGATVDLPRLTERPGTVIGPYKLVQRIGEGGMGTVFLAEQAQPVQRQVALKIIKPGMDSRQVIARFETERQALALMDHPNIARILDAGETDSGRPFFVMELVNGVPITQYCDQHHLTPQQRLELFVPVCQAVQHAHQKGIIHRDLNPSNVLVALYDGEPVPKVIDFGIAKATGRKLTDRTPFTEVGAVVGTLEYMSPEQAELNPLDIDTRSDIYSLGVLLYELLTGSTPLEQKRLKHGALLEMLRLIREEDPPRPSTRLNTTDQLPSVAANRGMEPKRLSGLLRGELDWIVMKALDKDRNRRYETANGLAHDIERHLRDEAVQACPPSAWYRLRKFTRRNKGALTAAALVALVLILGTVLSTWQAIRATRARDAERAARNALDSAREEKEQQRTRTNRELSEALVEAAGLREKAPIAPAGDAALAVQLREMIRRLATLTGSELADPVLVPRAQALLVELKQLEADRRLLDQLEEIRLQKTALKDEHFDVARADRLYQDGFRTYGLDLAALDADQAARRIKASPIRDQLLAALDDWLLVKTGEDLPGAERVLAVLKRADADAWRNQFREAFQHRDKKTLQTLARDLNVMAQPPATIVLLATVLSRMGEGSLAIEVLRAAQQRFPNDFWVNQALASALVQWGPVQSEEAIGYFRATLAIRPDSPGVFLNLGTSLLGTGDIDGAIAAYRKAIALDPQYATAHSSLGNALREKGDLTSAIAACQKAVSLKPDFAEGYGNLGVALQAAGDLPGASAALRKVVALKPGLASGHRNLGAALYATGDLDGAIAAYREAIALKPDYAEAHSDLGVALRDKGDLSGARAACRQAVVLSERLVQAFPKAPGAHSSLGGALNNLALVLMRDRDQLTEVRQLLERAISHQQLALQLRPQQPVYRQYLRNHYLNLAESLVQLGVHAEAARIAAELYRLYPERWPEYYQAAAFLARCVPLAETDAQKPAEQRAALAQSYGDQAVAALRQAVKKGFTDAGRLKKDPAFAPLQSRADFQQLLSDLEAGTPGKKDTSLTKP
jgi:serine/threonine protein kinase/tetratricopeptide (TPR) repeat protein